MERDIVTTGYNGEMLKCKVCGIKFRPTTWRRYTAVGNKITGVAAALGGTEKPIIYDAFDCPSGGCQIVVNERLRRVDDN